MPVTAVARNDGNEVELTIKGRFDCNEHAEFRNSYRNENPAASSALGMLLLLREHAGSDNAKISIINTPAEIMKIFKSANFETLFKIS